MREVKAKLMSVHAFFIARCRQANSVQVTLRKPRDFPAPANGKAASTELGRTMFGSMTAVRESKANIWSIRYDTGKIGGAEVYLDAHTGNVLSIIRIPKGG